MTSRAQDYPFGLATCVGQSSWFLYALDPAPHRRTGRLSPAQRARQQQLRQPSRAGRYQGSFHRLLDVLAGLVPATAPLPLVTDGHRAYRRALERHPGRARFEHRAHPNPKRGSKGSPPTPQALERDRAMFAVDLLHGLARHTSAHHGRETIAFGRRLNAVLERFFLLASWRNCSSCTLQISAGIKYIV